MSTQFAWVIEAPGARYLAVQRLSNVDSFEWSTDHNKAIRFGTKDQADAVRGALRCLDRTGKHGLFDFEATLGPAEPIEHGWI